MITKSHIVFQEFPTVLKSDSALILGCPTRKDGSPTGIQKSRIDLAMQLNQRQPIANWFVSGGAVKNHHIEAEMFEKLLIDKGISKPQITKEIHARDTIENLQYTFQLANDKNLTSLFIVTNTLHQLHTWRLLVRFHPERDRRFIYIKGIGPILRVGL